MKKVFERYMDIVDFMVSDNGADFHAMACAPLHYLGFQ